MKRFTKLLFVLLVASVFAVSCKKDKEAGKLTFELPAVFIPAASGTVTVGFSAIDINPRTLSITSNPKGWEKAVLNIEKQTVTITAPAEFKADVLKSGSVILSGSSFDGVMASASLFVGVVETEDLSSKPANSYLVSEANKHYTFDAMHKNGTGSAALATARVDLIWQSASGLVQYVKLDQDKASFYVGATDDDKLTEGNALIGAYDAAGTLLWSWHIWVTDFDVEEGIFAVNGYQIMGRNLGALNNANAKPEEILASYGLYYQWGRKDPFIGPSTYQASNGASAAMYNDRGSRVSLKTAASSAETGTMTFATQNPLIFITGVEASANDWRWSDHSDGLWSDLKSENDPCPFGWKVAPAAAFAGLSIKEALNVGYETYYQKYAWTLTKGDVESLFIGAGRRIYTNSTIQNIYNPLPARSAAMEAQPWVGYYWTGGAHGAQSGSGTNAQALHFWFNKADVAASGVNVASSQARANGMSVRCVKLTFK